MGWTPTTDLGAANPGANLEGDGQQGWGPRHVVQVRTHITNLGRRHDRSEGGRRGQPGRKVRGHQVPGGGGPEWQA